MSPNKKRMPVISLTVFFLVLLSTGLSGYYVWQGFLHGFDGYLPILASCLLMDGLGIFALIFKVSFETKARAIVPFIASLSLLIVCSIHLAALANMRTGAISQDEQDTRTQTQDDYRHARNVADANALVAANCPNCSPERKRRMYQSEMGRLEKSPVSRVDNIKATSGKNYPKSWGRRYVEDFATAVQLIFGLLCGLAMLVNNFVRLYADEPVDKNSALAKFLSTGEFPSEIDVNERQSLSLSQKREKLSLSEPNRKDALKKLRECLKLIAFHTPGRWFKADLVRGGVTIRLFKRDHGHEISIAETTQSDKLLMAVDRPDFQGKLIDELRHQGFEI